MCASVEGTENPEMQQATLFFKDMTGNQNTAKLQVKYKSALGLVGKVRSLC